MQNRVEQGQLMYEGKAKRVYATTDPALAIVDYKDDATAFNGQKRGTIAGKGAVNNRMSNALFAMLSEKGIPTHLVEELDERRTLVKRVEIVPVEVIVRNIAAGGICQRLGLPLGQRLAQTVLEYCYKSDELGDPMINLTHIYAMELATPEQMQTIERMALEVNRHLRKTFLEHNLILVDFKLEFGLVDGQIVLADEISPDTCRLWDAATGERLDKDRFRQDMGGVEQAYEEVARRLLGSRGESCKS